MALVLLFCNCHIQALKMCYFIRARYPAVICNQCLIIIHVSFWDAYFIYIQLLHAKGKLLLLMLNIECDVLVLASRCVASWKSRSNITLSFQTEFLLHWFLALTYPSWSILCRRFLTWFDMTVHIFCSFNRNVVWTSDR